MTSFDLQAILPELLLAVYAMLALVGGGLHRQGQADADRHLGDRGGDGGAGRCWIGSATAAATGAAFGGLFTDDAFARFGQVGVLLAGAAVLMAGQETMAQRGLDRFEYPLLIALATVGMMVMVSAGDLMTLYMGLELQSLSLYVVAAMNRDSREIDRGGDEILRARRAVVGPAALRRLARLRLFRHHAVRRHHCRRHRRARRASACCSASPSWPPASPSRSRPCRSTCGRRTSTRARRRRSPPSSPPRRNSRRWGCSPG